MIRTLNGSQLNAKLQNLIWNIRKEMKLKKIDLEKELSQS
jgi:hypothetical protein